MSDGEMSGLLPLFDTIISIVVKTKQVYDDGNGVHGLPAAFQEVQARLPVVQSLLVSIQADFDEATVDEATYKTARLIAVTCEDKAKQLCDVFCKAIATEGTSNLTLWYKAVRTSRSDKKVKSLMHGILLDVQLLMSKNSMDTASRDQQEQILQVIKELSGISDHEAEDQVGGKLGPRTLCWVNQQIDFSTLSTQYMYDEPFRNRTEDESAIQELDDILQECYNTLRLSDGDTNRAHLVPSKRDMVHGTCQWIQSNTTYLEWASSRSRLLWIIGGPGTGKTMLSAFLAEHLKRSIRTNASTVLLQYFWNASTVLLHHSWNDKDPYRKLNYSWDDREVYRNTAVTILKVLIYQLVEHQSQLIKYLRPDNGVRVTPPTQSLFEPLWVIYERMILDPALGPIYLVLDGLLECEEASVKILLRRIVEFVSAQNCQTSLCRFKVIICSHEQPGYLSTNLSDTPRISLDKDARTEVNHDVDLLIQAKIEKLSREPVPWPESLRRHVRNVFRDRAQGIFLWVSLVAQVLARSAWTEIEAELAQVPPGLDQLYAHLFLQIDVSRRQIASKILGWVTMAKRSLSLTELSVAVDVQLGEAPRSKSVEVIKDHVVNCGHFLRLEQAKRRFEPEWEEHVYLVHQSARDYLLRSGRVDRYAVTREIARKCFQYLQDDSMRRSVHFPKPLRSYVALYWHVHAKDLDAAEDIFQLSLPFYQEESIARDRWLTALQKDLYRVPEHSDPRGLVSFPLLHAAAYLGLLPVSYNMFCTKSKKYPWSKRREPSGKVNQLDAVGATALARAAQGGHMAVVKLLLEKQADINATGADQRISPLLLALEEGHESIAQLLIERGADVEADKTSDLFEQRSALELATTKGLTSTVQMLLRREADSQARATMIGTALRQAASWGHEPLVRGLLLHPGAAHMRNGGDRALIGAAYAGQVNIVQILLDAHADVEARDESGMSALSSAVKQLKGPLQERVVRLLLEHGADVEARAAIVWDLKDATALLFAAKKSTVESVRLLLDLGADMEARDAEGRTALMHAVREQKCDIADLLLKAGTDIEGRDNDGHTALMHAVTFRKFDAADLLLKSGADVEARDLNKRTMLIQVVRYQEEQALDAAELLLRFGADIEARGRQGKTPLMYALKRSKLDAAELLLKSGTDTEARDSYGRTALMRVLGYHTEGTQDGAELLLKYGADLEARDGKGRTTLMQAVDCQRADDAQFLLAKGADVRAKDGDERSILMVALERMVEAQRPSEPLTRMLLSAGADAQAIDARGRVTLTLAKRGCVAAKKRADSLRDDLEIDSGDYDKYRHFAKEFKSIYSLLHFACPDLRHHKDYFLTNAVRTQQSDPQSTIRNAHEDSVKESTPDQ